MERIAPLRLAGSWDNVGLLLESPVANSRKDVMLTIDLTTEVLEETLASNAAVVVSYHPPVFKGLKAITMSNPLQASLLQSAANGVSIYSPHSALDSVHGGINDWLADGILGSRDNGSVRPLVETDLGLEGAEGRLVELNDPVTMSLLIQRMKVHLSLQHIQVGYASAASGLSSLVRTIAICAGSGGSMLQGRAADVYLTGEMSHHEVLAAVATGTNVMLCGHTNTERGYLSVLAGKLQSELEKEVQASGITVGDILLSKNDAHPLQIV
ncbi:hypothetical protein AMATHDRAFT_156630 [Amanita thiersii Skay4041]|uniref:Uncharacterized protein n=1 Tax=Amanita thiersii Skay4041 TaxID=703135 RepID=A0A2A9N718_9AGAR|nr:hypothetical protein AMATHDRAFT_156630 [Amanita thiersii Skay4041]